MIRGPVPTRPGGVAPRTLELTVDERAVAVPEGVTILDACTAAGVATPTLCFLQTLTPVNACRVCVVELDGSRTLVPACARKAESGMVVRTDSERVRHSRKLVLELLGSSVDLSTAPDAQRFCAQYAADATRFGPDAATVAQPVKIDNNLYVRDYSKCILCYKCVYCGNCIGVCPTGALMFSSEHDLRERGQWDESRQTQADTICPYCGVGCTLRLHVQDDEIVKVTAPLENDVTHGNLCVKGRFGTVYVQNRDKSE